MLMSQKFVECYLNFVAQGRKVFIVIIGMIVVINSTMGSSLPSNAVPIISKHFHITSSYAEILPISMYIFGYILGPLLFGPLSETYGRKPVMILTFLLFTIFTLACALARNFPALLIFRFLTGVNASSPISVTGGIYADIYNDPVTRGRAMAVFMGVSIPPGITIGYQLTELGNLRWPSYCSSSIRIRCSHTGLALGFLDWLDIGRCFLDTPPLSP
jgi:MFS family permease